MSVPLPVGDLHSQEIRSSKGYLGFLQAPEAVSMDVPTLSDLKDSSGTMITDSNRIVSLWKHRRGDFRAFHTVLADGLNQRVWAAGATVDEKRSQWISCFDTASKLEVAKLAYPDVVAAQGQGFTNFTTCHTRCGDCIVGCGSTSELFICNGFGG